MQLRWLAALGRGVAHHRRAVLAATIVLVLGLGVAAAGALSTFSLARFELSGSESLRAKQILTRQFDTGSADVVLMVTAKHGTVDDAAVAARGRTLTRRLAAHPGIAAAWSYWTRARTPTLRGTDGAHALVLARMTGDVNQRRSVTLPAIERDLVGADDVVEVGLGGGEQVFRQVADQARRDFLRAELIILPLLFLLLLAVQRRVLAALLPMAVGVIATLGTLAALRGLAAFTEISTFAANLALVLGLGLGVDYGLLMINRFRIELAADPDGAVGRTVRTAGRTVLFSGVTVAASLSMLLLFPFPFLRSFDYAGIAVLAFSVLAALVVLPALLAVAGPRVLRRRVPSDGQPGIGLWRRFAERVWHRPIAYGGVVLVVLLAIAAPTLGLRFGDPDDRVLPAGTSSRSVSDQIRAGFATEETDVVQVVAPHTTAGIGAYAGRLSEVPGVYRVETVTGSYDSGRRTGAGGHGFVAGGGTYLAVFVAEQRLLRDPDAVIGAIRAVPAPGPVLVGGYPAELTDFRAGLTERMPLVLGLGLLATAVILFAMTRSILLPLKASLLNALSLAVMFGVLVWVFQQGHLSGALGFTATGTLDTTIPILMFCVVYGLSMDYEVFLLDRIIEEYRRSGDTRQAVVTGIGATGPLVTAAALLLAASFAVYASSGVVY
jgi:RND superfamily putative drug exporter